jgi:6-phosphogluconolactonase
VTRLTTCPDAETVAQRAAAYVVRQMARAREERGAAHLALSGGRTPGRTYELLASEPADLTGVRFWFADERCVAPDDEQSNYRLAAETLLRPANIAAELVYRMEGELGPEEGARHYAHTIVEHLSETVLDVVVLGIGPDGHIASLFPGASSLDADEHTLCLGVEDSPKPPPERITLSLSVLRKARRCVLLATGASKADAVNAMLAPPSRHVPASLLRRERLALFVDDDAAPKGPRP